jgi:predicted GNAT family acetyltransferase
MTGSDSAATVVRNDADHRYELHVGELVVAFTEFRVRPGYLVLVHTETDPLFEGRGYGSALARGMLDDIRGRGEKIKAECPFVAAFIKRHSEYEDLLVGNDL